MCLAIYLMPVNLMFQSQSGDTDEGATGGDDSLGDSSEKEHEIEVDDVSLHSYCLSEKNNNLFY